jgi:hypothetical protein
MVTSTATSYPTQREAIDAAVAAAHDASGRGKFSQVLVQGEDLLFRTEWTYGKDPYTRLNYGAQDQTSL